MNIDSDSDAGSSDGLYSFYTVRSRPQSPAESKHFGSPDDNDSGDDDAHAEETKVAREQELVAASDVPQRPSANPTNIQQVTPSLRIHFFDEKHSSTKELQRKQQHQERDLDTTPAPKQPATTVTSLEDSKKPTGGVVSGRATPPNGAVVPPSVRGEAVSPSLQCECGRTLSLGMSCFGYRALFSYLLAKHFTCPS